MSLIHGLYYQYSREKSSYQMRICAKHWHIFAT
jgi:hypothetical protein